MKESGISPVSDWCCACGAGVRTVLINTASTLMHATLRSRHAVNEAYTQCDSPVRTAAAAAAAAVVLTTKRKYDGNFLHTGSDGRIRTV